MGSQRVGHHWATCTFTLTIHIYGCEEQHLIHPKGKDTTQGSEKIKSGQKSAQMAICISLLSLFSSEFASFLERQDVACACLLSCFSRVWPFATLWTIAHQVPLSMGFSRQEYWSVLPSLPPGDLPYPGIEPVSLMSPALASGFFTTSATREAQCAYRYCLMMLAHLSCLLCSKNYSKCFMYVKLLIAFSFEIIIDSKEVA